LSDILDEEGYIYRWEYCLKKVKIPEGHVKCPVCNGYGEIRRYYGPPGDRGQFMACWACKGQGYIKKEWVKELKKLP